jgi:two-component system response regulator FlrC
MAKKVLHVDDEEGWRSLVAESLAAAGYDVISAANASEAMTSAEGADLGLIILDLNLGGENGMMLMKFLRHNHPDVPILIYSGLDNDDAAVRQMMGQGVDQYLQKGDLAELIVTVARYLG